MTEKDREKLYKMFQEIGKAAISKFSELYGYTNNFVQKELDEMIDSTYGTL